ncbi:hypothetical protein ISCGN_026151 [Ixodes scapularis]
MSHTYALQRAMRTYARYPFLRAYVPVPCVPFSLLSSRTGERETTPVWKMAAVRQTSGSATRVVRVRFTIEDELNLSTSLNFSLKVVPSPPFLPSPGTPTIPWDEWYAMFETYMIASRGSAMDDGRRTAILLSSLGVEGQRTYRKLPELQANPTAIPDTVSGTSGLPRLRAEPEHQLPQPAIPRLSSAACRQLILLLNGEEAARVTSEVNANICLHDDKGLTRSRCIEGPTAVDKRGITAPSSVVEKPRIPAKSSVGVATCLITVSALRKGLSPASVDYLSPCRRTALRRPARCMATVTKVSWFRR